MAKVVIMPALGMAQETGTLLQWFKAPGQAVAKGEPLMEIETDKATVEIESPASGVLAHITASPGDVVPVGQVIAMILAPNEANPAKPDPSVAPITATPVAARMAAEHGLDLAHIKPQGGKVQKEDVLAYVAARQATPPSLKPNGRILASPKARRLAQERGLDLATLAGSGPEGAVLATDVIAFQPNIAAELTQPEEVVVVSRIWRVMAERLTQAWTTIPHFYLAREVNARRLVEWRVEAQKRATEKITLSDLLVKLVAAALRQHPRLNASWQDGTIRLNHDINIGLAVAVEEGLVVPVIHQAEALGLNGIAARRKDLVAKAQSGKFSLSDLEGGTFTLSNLGMYGIDQFNAIVNPPQAAILAVGRLADRIVPINGQPVVQPMLTFSLSCDHRVVDGARGAQFLQTLSDLIEDPLRLLD